MTTVLRWTGAIVIVLLWGVLFACTLRFLILILSLLAIPFGIVALILIGGLFLDEMKGRR